MPTTSILPPGLLLDQAPSPAVLPLLQATKPIHVVALFDVSLEPSSAALSVAPGGAGSSSSSTSNATGGNTEAPVQGRVSELQLLGAKVVVDEGAQGMGERGGCWWVALKQLGLRVLV
jgi:hypothetical protein